MSEGEEESLGSKWKGSGGPGDEGLAGGSSATTIEGENSLEHEIAGFIVSCKLDRAAATALQKCKQEVQRAVLAMGSVAGCRYSSSATMARVQLAKES